MISGCWYNTDEHTQLEYMRAPGRCTHNAPAFIGFAMSGSGSGPPSDPAWKPFYELCIEAKIPALIFVGTTGLGAGLPGGGGIVLDDCPPRHLDQVAAKHPQL